MTIRELLEHEFRMPTSAGTLETDALREEGALLEAQLVGLHLHAVNSTAAALFDLRTALAYPTANAAILRAQGTRRVDWQQKPSNNNYTAWNVIGSHPAKHDRLLTLTLDFYPDARLLISAVRADFFVGVVPGLPQAPPDFVHDNEDAIWAGMPSWDSPFRLLQGSSLDYG